MGRDDVTARRQITPDGFNSRAPHGARLSVAARVFVLIGFQFTRPAWGATPTNAPPTKRDGVSIHAPRMGRDACQVFRADRHAVSIHAPRMGRDFVS